VLIRTTLRNVAASHSLKLIERLFASRFSESVVVDTAVAAVSIKLSGKSLLDILIGSVGF
jgi:hypothetical protein